MTKTKTPAPAMPTPVDPGSFEVSMVVAKETPGTIQYKEVEEPMKPQVIGTLYVKKHAALALGPAITVLVATA